MTPVFGVVRTGTSVQHEESNDDEIRTGAMMAVRAPSHQSKFLERVCSTLLSLSLSLSLSLRHRDEEDDNVDDRLETGNYRTYLHICVDRHCVC
mmetsp:Transcript_46078/g.51532  ORF Transcript_46078/g.51532 Transcript_46078/m.51532 type:complete len:94 (+) Transcript_46078:532-813(+)